MIREGLYPLPFFWYIQFMELRPSYRYKAQCVRVIDGDTIVVDIDLGFETILKNRHIRLNGYNAAELTATDPKERDRAGQATAMLTALIGGKECVIETIKTKAGVERQTLGRYVADVYQYCFPDKSINQHMAEFCAQLSQDVDADSDAT